MKNFRIIRFSTEFPNGKLPDTRQQPDSLSLLVSLVSVTIYYISENVSIPKDTALDSVHFI
jgi:hypothetical protein